MHARHSDSREEVLITTQDLQNSLFPGVSRGLLIEPDLNTQIQSEGAKTATDKLRETVMEKLECDKK